MGKRVWLIVAAAGLVVGFIVPGLRGGDRGTAAQEPAEAAQAMGQAADFALPNADGKIIRLRDLRGKVVILSFWATWCPPCQMELPHLQALSKKYAGKPVTVLGVNLDVQGKTLKRWLAKRNLTFPVVADTKSAVGSAYHVEGIPTLLVIDQRGIIRHRAEGFDPNMDKNISKLVDSLLKKK